MPAKNRIIYIDVLRIICSFMVISIHISSLYLYNSPTFTTWHLCNIIDSLCRCGVPIFFMLAGGLTLTSEKTLDIKNYYLSRFFRIYIPTIIWCVIYAGLNQYVYPGRQNFWDQVKSSWISGSTDHLWFMYQLIALAIISPFLCSFVKKAPESLLFAALLFLFIGNNLPVTLSLIGLNVNYSFFVPVFYLGHIFYYFLGYFMFTNKITMKIPASIALFISGVAITAAGVWWQSHLAEKLVQSYYLYGSANIVICVISFYELVRNLTERISFSSFAQKIIEKMASLTYGVYFIHMLSVLGILYPLVRVKKYHPLLILGVGSFATIVFSYAIAAAVSYIPFLRSILLGEVKKIPFRNLDNGKYSRKITIDKIIPVASIIVLIAMAVSLFIQIGSNSNLNNISHNDNTAQNDFQEARGENFIRVEMSLTDDIAKNFMDGLYYNYRFGTKDDLLIDWNLPGVTDMASLYRYNSMFFLDPLVKMWGETGDDRYAKAGIQNIIAWIEMWPVYDENPKYVWHDDGTARRLYYVSSAYKAWNALLSDYERQLIEDSMKIHADLLADESFYQKYHNHGIYQDQALYHYSLNMPDEKSEYYKELVKERINDYCVNVIADDGTVLEHSIGYQEIVAGVIYSLALEIEPDDKQFVEQLFSYIDKIGMVIVAMTDPSGNMVIVGDCDTPVLPRKFWDHIPEYRFVSTKGKEGKQPEWLDIVLADRGYATMRSDWKLDGSSDFIDFNAAAKTFSHKHVDELGFILWHNGALFDDAGYGGYQVDAPFVAYSYSGWGHNILIPNWKTQNAAKLYNEYYNRNTEHTMETTFFTDWVINEPVAYITGVTERTPGIKQERTITWEREANIVTVNDHILAERSGNDYLALYRLANDIIPEIRSEDEVDLFRGDKLEAVMSFSALNNFTIDAVYGDEDEYIKGWDSKSDFEGDNPDKIWIIAFEMWNAPTESSMNAKIQLK